MPRQRKAKRQQSQARLTRNMWGLRVSNSALEDCEDPEGFPHSENPDKRTFLPRKWEDSEKPYEYGPGGLHPIHIEETLDGGRYKIIHKLGHGLTSTVWLARDGTLNRYVSIKILTAGASKIGNELGCLEYLSSKRGSNHPGQRYISASFLDRHFLLDGPNGRHLVLVSKVSGPSISQLSEWNIRSRESLARRIALQLTQGLAYLHSEGICHGNLTSCDVLFQLTDFDSWSQEKVYEQLGIPTVTDIDTFSPGPSFPRYLVDAPRFLRASSGFLTDNIRIIDYGDSFRVGWQRNPNTIRQGNRMGSFSAPENLSGSKVTRTSDLWALGCVIYEIRAGIPLIISRSDPLYELTELLGSHYDLHDPKSPISHGYSGLSCKEKVTEKSTKERIYEHVAKIQVEIKANSECAMVESRGLDETRNRFTQIRPYIKWDPNFFWKPLPLERGTPYVDHLIRTWAEIDAEKEMWKMEKPSPKISPTEAELLSNLLFSLLSHRSERRRPAASLAMHPWFVEPVRLEAKKGRLC